MERPAASTCSPQSLVGDRVLKHIVRPGLRGGARPEWGDEVTVAYTLREHEAAAPSSAIGVAHGTGMVFRMKRRLVYVVGVDEAGFLPRRLAELVLCSMYEGEQADVFIDIRYFLDREPFSDPPWHLDVEGYERIDVEHVHLALTLHSLRKAGPGLDLLAQLGRPSLIMKRCVYDPRDAYATTQFERGEGENVETFRCTDDRNVPRAGEPGERRCPDYPRQGSEADHVELRTDSSFPERSSQAAGHGWQPFDEASRAPAIWRRVQKRMQEVKPDDRHIMSDAVSTLPTPEHQQEGVVGIGPHLISTSVGPRSVACIDFEGQLLHLYVEAYDRQGEVLLPKAKTEYVHGCGEQPDCIELAVATMEVGEMCEVRCSWKDAMNGGKMGLSTEVALPVSWRLQLVSAIKVSLQPDAATMATGCQVHDWHAQRLRHVAAELFRQKRFLLALLKYEMLIKLLGRATGCNQRQRHFVTELRRSCQTQAINCFLHLSWFQEASERVAAVMEEHGISAKLLVLEGRACLKRDPSKALRSFLRAVKMDPSSARPRQLYTKAKEELRRKRRADRWFGGKDAAPRTLEANDPRCCAQCNRCRPMGWHDDDKLSKTHGRYMCVECWECWAKIRCAQQEELERRVDKAVHSDYSTHTDDLPSLDDVPRSWDERHPMWNRQRMDKLQWQV